MDEKRNRGEKTYGCLVENCIRVCSTPQKRRLHVIDAHHFPRDYDFWVIKWGTPKGFLPKGLKPSKSAIASKTTDTEGDHGMVDTAADRTDEQDKSHDPKADDEVIGSSSEADEEIGEVTTPVEVTRDRKLKLNLRFGHGAKPTFRR
ncbi:hypothetical protein EJ05DRAFT_477343 [Pseudovirgaria hyperparasitica]|uniref:C2H2-type domain-containing protein n=1 Tax=Pseudovirgaria hyperparasitica TaxID=470096 RepID=A0A6A6W4M2_9PEZI|nr:uncharacterized protein EJ05DRAFT_477343 [Pseudovirgaria hyperparasitica]KAF2757119.1 hypothetical protein EJ05DRAFT_477343 [Pseudovirgaria hyperparasitica]